MPHQLAPSVGARKLSDRLQVHAPGDGLGHPFDVTIPVADPGRPDRLQRGGGELLGGRRGMVDAPVGDEGVPERGSQVARIAYTRRKTVFWPRSTSIRPSNIE
jgi:hypothetical protein